MENMNAEKNAGRKKLLVPLVVLIMCGVALTGAAYAYSTSVTMNGAAIQGDYYSIDMYDSNAANAEPIENALVADKDFKVYTTKIVGEDYVAKVENGSFTRTVYVKIDSDLPSDQKYTLTATANVTGVTASQITITPTVTINGGTATLADAVKGTYYTVLVTCTVAPGSGDFWTGSDINALKTACDSFSGKLNIVVNAERVVPQAQP